MLQHEANYIYMAQYNLFLVTEYLFLSLSLIFKTDF